MPVDPCNLWCQDGERMGVTGKREADRNRGEEGERKKGERERQRERRREHRSQEKVPETTILN